MYFLLFCFTIMFMCLIAGIGAGITLAASKDKPRWAEVTVIASFIIFILTLGATFYFLDNPELW